VTAPLSLSPIREGAEGEIRRALPTDRERIAWIAHYFWGETEVLCFDRDYEVLEAPAFLAEVEGEVIGLLAYMPEPAEDRLTILLLNILPEYQGEGLGRRLLEAALAEAKRLGLSRVRVATTNDDLPALYLYQRLGFHLMEVVAGLLVMHHGGEESGFAGIPVRDEIRLEFVLAPPA
jgi:GNAT superfamily N-acetyltransferase